MGKRGKSSDEEKIERFVHDYLRFAVRTLKFEKKLGTKFTMPAAYLNLVPDEKWHKVENLFDSDAFACESPEDTKAIAAYDGKKDATLWLRIDRNQKFERDKLPVTVNVYYAMAAACSALLHVVDLRIREMLAVAISVKENNFVQHTLEENKFDQYELTGLPAFLRRMTLRDFNARYTPKNTIRESTMPHHFGEYEVRRRSLDNFINRTLKRSNKAVLLIDCSADCSMIWTLACDLCDRIQERGLGKQLFVAIGSEDVSIAKRTVPKEWTISEDADDIYLSGLLARRSLNS